MRSIAVVIAGLALGSQIPSATACETLDRSAASPVTIRRPVLGTEVRLTSSFGVRYHPILNKKQLHTGVDWAAPTGTPVIAAGAGEITSAEADGASGNVIVIDHGGGWQTRYHHLESFAVRKGDCVEAKAVIGAVGTTGISAGPHLHFEVLREGTALDPLQLPLKTSIGAP